jgi:glycosyltransferase involved in cell wall biosynthesis
LDSIINQNHKNWQLLAVDDHSKDNSANILKSYQDSRIQLLKNEGYGILAGLKTAQKYINGECVTRMDADDIMPRDKLKNLLKVIQSNSEGIIATGYVNYFGENQISEGYLRYQNWLNNTAKTNSFYEHIYRECVVASPNWMMSRADFEAMDGFNKLKYPEDYDMVFQWKKHSLTIKSCDYNTHHWREHKERTSRNSETYQQESFFRLKIVYFLKEFQIRKIYLLGTERKGILTAKLLKENSSDFQWFTHSSKQIGSEKENKKLEDVKELPRDGICILAIYPNTAERKRLELFLEKKGYKIGSTAHYF